MRQSVVAVVVALITSAVVGVSSFGFGGSEEKFVKKYAMMKVYESCFGLQVLKDVRREMKEAAQKCSGYTSDFDDKYVNLEPTEQYLTTVAMATKPTPANRKPPIHTADTLLLQQWSEQQNNHVSEGEQGEDNVDLGTDQDEEADTAQPPTRKPLDLSKLEEAILNINRPGNQLGVGQVRPGMSPNYHQAAGYYPPMFYPPPPPMPYPAPGYPYYPGYPAYPSYHQPPAAHAGPAYTPPYYSRSGYRSAKITKGFKTDKVAVTASTVAQSNGGMRQRKEVTSRTLVPPKGLQGLNVKASMDAMTLHSGTKLRNITCVMQQLGYLDHNLEPNYDRMVQRITQLTVPTDLKQDMVEGVKFCKQFSQCVPEMRKDGPGSGSLSQELLRPMFFFRCYKHKKLEACIMKDVRDRFASSTSSASEDSGTMTNELRRSLSSPHKDLASSVFEFMYGSAADDFDALL